MNIVKNTLKTITILLTMTLCSITYAEECIQPAKHSSNASTQQIDKNDPSAWFDELAKNG
ncbi:MAG: hypothetical protein BWK73_25065 [Thiothrix lacustris]|uniref:Uncharacterized protein n=1 Tax=Thiothrix lacustris TaxID=525917 RepID=A0A1Y1QLI8_9GAMM|nr:MAG: hypothetical protein BWK73_25065 [Thiothrix lacustris]